MHAKRLWTETGALLLDGRPGSGTVATGSVGPGLRFAGPRGAASWANHGASPAGMRSHNDDNDAHNLTMHS